MRAAPAYAQGVRFRAVIFDFFGTLTTAATAAGRAEAAGAGARLLGAPPEKFRTAWWRT